MGKTFELEPDQVDLLLEAIRVYRDSWEQQVPGMHRPTAAGQQPGVTLGEAAGVVQRCNKIESLLMGDVLPKPNDQPGEKS